MGDGFYFRLICASPESVREAWSSPEFDEAVAHLSGYARLGWRDSILLRLNPADGDMGLVLNRLAACGFFREIRPMPEAMFFQVNSRGDLP